MKEPASPLQPLRIVALADSLAMPRKEGPEVVRWEETWPTLLRRELCDAGLGAEVVNCGMRARTAETLSGNSFLEHVVFIEPELVVLQVGIVDCAPRIFSRRFKRILRSSLVPGAARRAIISWYSARRHRIIADRPLARVYTPPDRFRSCLEGFAKALESLEWKVDLLVIPIVVEWRIAEAKSPGYGANVKLYNEVLKRFCNQHGADWVELQPLRRENADLSAYFLDDGYHLSAAGNREIARALSEHLLSMERWQVPR